MKPVKFIGMNTNYVADGCMDLPTMVELDEDGERMITSVWQPSEDDLRKLNEGGCICLTVLGHQPPVAMEVVQEVGVIVGDL